VGIAGGALPNMPKLDISANSIVNSARIHGCEYLYTE
jgi:hypothetical protein